MTAPTKALPASTKARAQSQNGWGGSTPPDHRTTALQSAVAVLRGRPLTKTKDVLDMAEAFHQFLTRTD